MKKEPVALPSDPAGAEDFDVSAEPGPAGAPDPQNACRAWPVAVGIRRVFPVGTLRDWEQARVSPPDFAIAYVRVIGKFPEMVAVVVG